MKTEDDNLIGATILAAYFAMGAFAVLVIVVAFAAGYYGILALWHFVGRVL